MVEGLVRRTQYWNLPTHTVRAGATGHGESLIDLEEYLLPMTDARASALHTWGVAQGLEVSAAVGAGEVTVSPGVAFDASGRTIVLSAAGVAVTDPAVDPTAVLDIETVAVGPAGVVLPTAGSAGSCVLTLTWREVQRDSGNSPTLLHAPWLRLLPANTFPDSGEQIVLASLELSAAGLVTSLAPGLRRLTASPTGRVELRAPQSTVGSVGQAPVATLGAEPNGDVLLELLAGAIPALRVSADSGDARLSGALTAASLTADGAATVGSTLSVGAAVSVAGELLVGGPVRTGMLAVGLGDAASARDVHIEGTEVHSGGPGGGYSFSDREMSSFVETPESGQRWVWYAKAGEARLWSHEDVLKVRPGAVAAASSDGVGLDVFRRMRVRSNGTFSAGIWFHQDADRGFVGMLDDTHVGFYGANGAGWGIVMDTAGAGVGIGIGAAATAARLHVDGFTAIRAAGRISRPGGPFPTPILFRGVGVEASGDIGIRSTGQLWAGQFEGDVRVNGTLSKSGGGFTIDHPVDPAGKYLSHSFVESPEMLNIYAGKLVTDLGGFGWIELPPYFEALNRDVTCTLTPVGREKPHVTVVGEISGHRWQVRSDPGRVTVHWLVTGVRQDPWANAHRIVPETPKPGTQDAPFLHPELYGAALEQELFGQPVAAGNESTE
ncbi:hypothetical protein AB0I34_36245 [Kribbella sp. NPDC050281]|uniref:hypothetical protein n=1 Tax=Kribbella sp. NPDC050281 TaxID=3155515 RepID=UPI0033C196B3